MAEESQENVAPAAKAKGKAAKPVDAEAGAATDAPGEGKAVAPKKEKAPAVEAKPFAEFINQDYLPALSQALADKGIGDLHVDLQKANVPVRGFESAPACSQVVGSWSGGKRKFNIYFFDDDIQGKRGFSCTDSGSKPSSLESFLIDERKITLDLLVSGLLLRLNSQKWLQRN